MGKSHWLGRCLLIRVILFQKFVPPLGSLALRSIDMSKRRNQQSNYPKINSLISKFTGDERTSPALLQNFFADGSDPQSAWLGERLPIWLHGRSCRDHARRS